MAALTRRHPPIGLVAALFAALAVVRLLPEHGLGLWLRLLVATAIVLLPGRLLARRLGTRSYAATVVLSLTLLAPCLGVVFVVEGDFSLALWLYALAGAIALVLAGRRPLPPAPVRSGLVLAGGLALGVALWHVAGVVAGDAPFHLARVRKLVELGSLVPGSVNEFIDGSLHPGYAFPLWHAFLGAIARVAGVDPSLVVQHEAAFIAPLALVVTYELALALFRSTPPALAAVLGQAALSALAPPHGGAFAQLALPTSAGRFLLAPALAALFVRELEQPSRAGKILVACAALTVALVHPTYLAFALLLLGGYALARAALRRAEFWAGVRTLGLASIAGGVYLLSLLPLAHQTASHDPSAAEVRRAIAHYGTQLTLYGDRYALDPGIFARSGPVAIAALLLAPLAFLCRDRRWAPFVLGGGVAVLGVCLIPHLFTPLADLASLSQARRLAGFFPFAIAFAGGIAILAAWMLRIVLLPLALIAGLVLELVWPGNFDYGFGAGGGPGWLAWLSLAGMAAGLVIAIFRERSMAESDGARVTRAAALFILPLVIGGLGDWTAAEPTDKLALTPGLVHALRERVPARAVVFSDLGTSYRIAAAVPVYVAASPPAHVADTERNHPYQRRRQIIRYFNRGGKLSIPRGMGARWMVLRQEDAKRLKPKLPLVYEDGTFVLYRVTR